LDLYHRAQYHLRRIYGDNARFRPGQWEALYHLLNGKHALVVMPTGAGKSLIYQLAALLLNETAQSPQTALVISPLIALMKDQVDSLVRHKISATFINSTLSPAEQTNRLAKIAAGKFTIVYASPERLRSTHFMDTMHKQTLSLMAVDEAHCISEWGHDFRPDYLRLAKVRLDFAQPLTVALTATATPQVQTDIIRLLGLPISSPGKGERNECTQRIITGFNRPNLSLQVVYTSRPQVKMHRLRELLRELREGVAIIYTGTRREAEEVADFVKDMVHHSAEYYHAGLNPETRDAIHEKFSQGKLNIVVATNAFGMGIDRADVRMVIHYNLPGSLETYYQEAGRAGRDGLQAQAVLLYSPDDRALQEWFIKSSEISTEELRGLHNSIKIPLNGQAWFRFEELSLLTSMPEVKLKIALAALERAGALERLGDEGMHMLLKRGAWDVQAIDFAVRKSTQHLEHRKRQLEKVVNYAEANTCRRRMLLDHFGDSEKPSAIHCCDNCLDKGSNRPADSRGAPDATRPFDTRSPDESRPVDLRARSVEAVSQSQKTALVILDSIKCMKPAIGRVKLTQILKGSHARDILKFRYDKSKYYARLETFPRRAIEAMIDDLINKGYIKVIGGEYPVLRLTPQGERALRGNAPIPLNLPRQIPTEKLVDTKAARCAGGTVAYTEELFKRGLKPAEIAKRRNLTVNTIYNHLAGLIAHGRINVEAVVSAEVREKVEEAIRKVGSVVYLTPIKAILPEEIDYPICRCVVEAWKRKDYADDIDMYLARPHPRPLQGPWHTGWALGFHGSFAGKEWSRSSVGQLTYHLKYQGDRSVLPELVDLAAALLAIHPEMSQVEAIIPTPPSTERSCDPVSAFSEALGERIEIKVHYALQKTRKTAPQKEFRTAAQKRANVVGAFSVKLPVNNLKVLVIDDLYDSGATLEEITRLLINAGARRVYVLTLTKTIHSDT
jgi:ATP-dependent DNA helicase RecQ